MKIDFSKGNGLVPAIVQDAITGRVLMLGFMNEAALIKTESERRVTFFSRTRQLLWTKGETSGNFLAVQEILVDCDHDTILVKATPEGPTCHTGQETCFGESNEATLGFISKLQSVIRSRKTDPSAKSYTTSLLAAGVPRCAQKVGEEAVEMVVAALGSDRNHLLEEAADLFFHYLVLLEANEANFADVLEVLKNRHKPG